MPGTANIQYSSTRSTKKLKLRLESEPPSLNSLIARELPPTYLLANINTFPLKILVDTGNLGVDLLSETWWKRFHPNAKLKEVTNITINTADTNNELIILGKTPKLKVTLQNNYSIYSTFVVAKNLQPDSVLSARSIAQIPIIPDLSRGIAYIGPDAQILKLHGQFPANKLDQSLEGNPSEEEALNETSMNNQAEESAKEEALKDILDGQAEETESGNYDEYSNPDNIYFLDTENQMANITVSNTVNLNPGKVTLVDGIITSNGKVSQIGLISPNLNNLSKQCFIPTTCVQVERQLDQGNLVRIPVSNASNVMKTLKSKTPIAYFTSILGIKDAQMCGDANTRDSPGHISEGNPGTDNMVHCLRGEPCKNPLDQVDIQRETDKYKEIICQLAGKDYQNYKEKFTDDQASAIDKLFSFQISSNRLLDKKEKEVLIFLLFIFDDIISKGSHDVGKTNVLEFKIDTENHEPISAKCRPMNPHILEKWKETCKKWLEDGIIEASESPWSSPLVPVPKKNGDIRFATDYRRLNDISRADTFPVNNVIASLSDNQFKESKYFISIDLAGAFLAIPVEEGTQDKLSIVTPTGTYKMLRMAFGHKNSAQFYNRLMMALFEKEWELNHLQSFFDDHLIPCKTFNMGIFRFIKFLTIIESGNLRISPSKSHLFTDEANFLGHQVGKGVIKPANRLTETIVNWPTPTSINQLRSFLGTSNYYRRYIKDYATHAGPLNKLLKKKVEWRWDKDEETAFQNLKDKLCKKPVLYPPNFNLPFQLDTDASGNGLGAVLSQLQEDGTIRPIGYWSKTLNAHEANYSITKLELLAVILGIENFQYYLLGRHFTINCDHQALKWLRTSKNIKGQLFRWSQRLLPYDFEINYVPGKKMGHADGLSRMYSGLPDEKPSEEFTQEDVRYLTECGLKVPDKYKQIMVLTRAQRAEKERKERENQELELQSEEFPNLMEQSGNGSPTPENEGSEPDTLDLTMEPNPNEQNISKNYINKLDPVSFQKAQKKDKNYFQVMAWITDGITPKTEEVKDNTELAAYKKLWPQLRIKDGNLYHRKVDKDVLDPTKVINYDRLIIPESLRKQCLSILHCHQLSAHPGIDRTLKMARRSIFWPGITKMITEEIRKCGICIMAQETKQLNNTQMGQTSTGVYKRLSTFYVDIVGPILPNTSKGIKYILSFTDAVTKYVELFAINNISSDTIIKILIEKIIVRYGLGLTLISDNGRQFVSETFKRVCAVLGIVKLEIIPFNPMSNPVERCHRTIKKVLRSLVYQNDVPPTNWNTMLPYVTAAINFTPLSTLPGSPHFLTYGEEPINGLENYLSIINKPVTSSYSTNELLNRFHKMTDVIYTQQQENHLNNKERFDAKVKPDHLEVGDFVLILAPQPTKWANSRKLTPSYDGPYQIVDIPNEQTVIILNGSRRNRILRRRVRRVGNCDLSKICPENLNLEPGPGLSKPKPMEMDEEELFKIPASIFSERSHNQPIESMEPVMEPPKLSNPEPPRSSTPVEHRDISDENMEDNGSSTPVEHRDTSDMSDGNDDTNSETTSKRKRQGSDSSNDGNTKRPHLQSQSDDESIGSSLGDEINKTDSLLFG